jgi:hypothetical protein
MRQLLTVPDNCWQIGVDASNMENLIAAWWAWVFGEDGGEYYEIVKVGDPHETNAAAYSIAAGREVLRSEGKNITYAVLYGAQAAKVAGMLGISIKAAQKVIDAFWDTNYGLKAVKEYLEAFWEGTGKKYIKGIDGRKIWTRSKHSLLNAALQSTGAIMMDLAGIKLHRKLLDEGLYQKGCRRIIYYHDEYQLQIPEEFVRWKEFDTEEAAKEFSVDNFILSARVREENGIFKRAYCRVGELVIDSIEEATADLGSPIIITGEYIVGKSWADCH